MYTQKVKGISTTPQFDYISNLLSTQPRKSIQKNGLNELLFLHDSMTSGAFFSQNLQVDCPLFMGGGVQPGKLRWNPKQGGLVQMAKSFSGSVFRFTKGYQNPGYQLYIGDAKLTQLCGD